MNNAERKLRSYFAKSIYIDEWVSRCENSDRKPVFNDLKYIGEIESSIGKGVYYIFYDGEWELFVCEYRRTT